MHEANSDQSEPSLAAGMSAAETALTILSATLAGAIIAGAAVTLLFVIL